MTTPTAFCLADLTVYPFTLTVRQGEHEYVLQQKPLEVLVVLAERYPALVSRDELIHSVWDGNFYVGEKALTNAIWQLRQLFEAVGLVDAISTVRKKGYRLQLAPEFQTDLSAIGKLNAAQPDLALVNSASELAADTNVQKWSNIWRHLLWWSLPLLLVLTTSFVAFWLHRSPQAPVAITKQQGWSLYPTIDQAGTLMVYSYQRFGQHSNLFALDLADANATPRQLTFDEHDHHYPLLSPDGQQVYYASRTQAGHCQLRRLELQTLQSLLLSSCGRFGDIYLALSSDARYLYFNGSLTADGRSLYQLDLTQADAKAEPLPCQQFCQQRVRDMTASPDGRFLALTRRANRLAEEVFLYEIATGQERQLTFGHDDIRGLEWLPDSPTLLFSALQNGRAQAFLLDSQTGQQQQLTLDDFSYPSRVSESGEVFFQHDNSVAQLGFVKLNKASAVFPLTAGEQMYQAPDFHAGRAELVYISNESGYSELWVADANLQRKKQMTHLRGGLKYPRWSHDGRKVLFVSRKAEAVQDRLTILDVATGQLTFVETGMQVHGRPTWWHDDSAVLLPERGELVRLDLQNQQKTPLTQKGGDYGQMLNAQGFYFSKGRRGGLWWQPLNLSLTAAPAQQLLTAEQFSEVYAWTVTPTGIYFLKPQADGIALYSYDPSINTLSQWVLLPAEQINLSAGFTYDSVLARLLLEYSPIPRIDIMRWQLP